MDSSLIVVLAMMMVFIVIISKSALIVGESERHAVFRLGQFQHYVGPGMVILLPFLDRTAKLKVGAIGKLTSVDFATFGKTQFPVKNANAVRVGSAVQVSGFDSDGPILAPAAMLPTQRCPKCGHEY
ncbi:MAG: hypothetical protein AAF351_16280 [Pseudomonadota bacterium]